MPHPVATVLPARAQALLDAVAPHGSWSGPYGVVRLELDVADGAVESHDVRFGPAGAALDAGADPQAVLRLPLADALEIVAGRADGALLYLSGVLRIRGDEALVLGLGQALVLPGAEQALVDPRALDPVAVSRAIVGVPLEHLAAVMAGGFRSLVLGEVFSRLPEFLIEEKAARVAVTVGFSIGGRPDGGTDRYVVRIRHGVCTVQAGTAADEPVDATLVLEGHEFLRLVLGHLNPVRGVLSGDIRVQGQLVKALGFNSVMRIPGS
ncbi:MAG: hypothetical protein JWQ74_2088 [Marmoricola sp.]|nr:hypothetical protein [Marmoricola sp.]